MAVAARLPAAGAVGQVCRRSLGGALRRRGQGAWLAVWSWSRLRVSYHASRACVEWLLPPLYDATRFQLAVPNAAARARASSPLLDSSLGGLAWVQWATSGLGWRSSSAAHWYWPCLVSLI
jgi:hypothetical protein